MGVILQIDFNRPLGKLCRDFFPRQYVQAAKRKKRIKKTLCFKWFYSFQLPPIWVKQIGQKTLNFEYAANDVIMVVTLSFVMAEE